MTVATTNSLEQRVADLEREVQQLRRLVTSQSSESHPMAWLDTIGVFKNDDLFASIMQRGRQYRESLRPTEAERC